MEMMRLKALRGSAFGRFIVSRSFRFCRDLEFSSPRVEIYIYIGYIERVVDVIDNFELADSNCSIVGTLYREVCFSLLFCFRIDIILSWSCN